MKTFRLYLCSSRFGRAYWCFACKRSGQICHGKCAQYTKPACLYDSAAGAGPACDCQV